MGKLQVGKTAKTIATIALAAKLAFSPFQVSAEPLHEKSTLGYFYQYDLKDERPAIGLGVQVLGRQYGAGDESKSLEAGILAIVGRAVLLDEAFVKFCWAGNGERYNLALVRNPSQKIGWGIEAGYFGGEPISLGASVVAFEALEGAGHVQFYLKPSIGGENRSLRGRLAFIINYDLEGETAGPNIGAEMSICTVSANWSVSFLAAVLATTKKDGTLDGGIVFEYSTVPVFEYVRIGLNYEF